MRQPQRELWLYASVKVCDAIVPRSPVTSTTPTQCGASHRVPDQPGGQTSFRAAVISRVDASNPTGSMAPMACSSWASVLHRTYRLADTPSTPGGGLGYPLL